MAQTPLNAADQAREEQARVHGGLEHVFSHKVRDYLLARPDYPDALFEYLQHLGALVPRAMVADIGAGTGQLTRGLLSRGHSVVAIEPNSEMRAAADQLLGGQPGYSSRAGSAEDSGLAAGSVDLITAAQAFHWFDVASARSECLRILRPRAQVALIWNDRVADDPLNQALEPVFDRYGGSRRLATVASEERRHVPAFFGAGSFVTHTLPHVHALSREGLVALAFSRSYMPPRDTAEGQSAAAEIDRLFDRFSDGAAVLMHYQTLVIVGRPAEALPG